jgi:hypothetical protein
MLRIYCQIFKSVHAVCWAERADEGHGADSGSVLKGLIEWHGKRNAPGDEIYEHY